MVIINDFHLRCQENLYVQLQLAKDNAAFEVGGRQDMAALNVSLAYHREIFEA